MMKNIAIINNVDFGSTGQISLNLHRNLLAKGYRSYFCYGRGASPTNSSMKKIGSFLSVNIHALMVRMTGRQGFYSSSSITKLLRFFSKANIDTIYIVCIHGYYLNEYKLYKYVADNNIALVHIMIDEYAYGGKCAYNNGCNRYFLGCGNCPNKASYPTSLILDGSKAVFKMKQKAYQMLSKAAFVGPRFVVEKAKESPLLQNAKIVELDESIDMDIYYPRNTDNLYSELGISDNKIVITCIAPFNNTVNDRKGCRFFIELARRFESNNNYIFIHVGYMCEDKSFLPKNYIPIGFIRDQNKLAEYFSIGDLFVFPSLLDTMPNACLDSLACGVPLLCFDISGMPYVSDNTVGTFVEARNVTELQKVVQKIVKKNSDIIQRCRSYALSRYDSKKYNERLMQIGEYLNKI